jgi:NAD+ synthase (glutamine-hydrolysing)
MKIALTQLNYMIGDFEGNVARILGGLTEAQKGGASLAVFAELAVCGYPPRDFLEFSDFIEKSDRAVRQIASFCKGISAIVGAPSMNPAEKGKPLYNSAYYLADGRVKSVVNKTLLPNYDVFDEYRYFEPNRMPEQVIEHESVPIALTICEDLWNVADDPLYVRNPMDTLSVLNPAVMINIAASPFHYAQHWLREEILAKNARRYKLPLLYVNHVGGQTELLFDGGSLAMTPTGEISDRLDFFREQQKIIDLSAVGSAYVLRPTSYVPLPSSSGIQLIRDALIMGIRDYFRKMGFRRATLGLSGGIDSAVTLVLAAEALGKDNVLPVLLPSRFSSEHSVADAVQLCDNLGIKYEKISIDESFAAMENTLKPLFRDLPFDLAEENMQARLRAVILMAVSNKFGHILLNTSNKSEAAVGYGTLYGDMSGGLSVLGDIYKTQVYELAGLINAEKEVIPRSTVDKPPSAELRPDQKDSDSLPAYEILDRILFEYIEHRLGPNELIKKGFDEQVVKRVLKLVNTSEYKRYQSPPVLRVSPKAFGQGRRLPIAARYLS